MSDDLDHDIVGMCTECKTTIPTMTMARDPFAQAGQPSVCKVCGGVVAIMDIKDQKATKVQMDRGRGL
jgi:hypothetical protein